MRRGLASPPGEKAGGLEGWGTKQLTDRVVELRVAEALNPTTLSHGGGTLDAPPETAARLGRETTRASGFARRSDVAMTAHDEHKNESAERALHVARKRNVRAV